MRSESSVYFQDRVMVEQTVEYINGLALGSD